MTQSIAEATVINTYAQLEAFKRSLPPDTQLRFISGTSLNHNFGAICIVYDRDSDLVMLVPYYLKKSHQQTEPIAITENPESLAMRLLVKEGKLKSTKVTPLGSPFSVVDKRSEGEQAFLKFILLVTDIELEDRIKIKSYSEKVGDPVWVKSELLHYIFENAPIILGLQRFHPHLKAYERFQEYFPLYKNLERL